MENFNDNRICPIHDKKIIYICFNSAWHCEILCCDCLPIHSEIHVKNKTLAKIEKFDIFLSSYLEKLKQKGKIYDELLKEYNIFLKMDLPFIYDSNEQLKELNNFKKILYEEVDKRFFEIEKRIKLQIDLKFQNNKINLEKDEKEILEYKSEINQYIIDLKSENINEKFLESIKFSSKFMSFKEIKNEGKELFQIKLDETLEIHAEKLKKMLDENFALLIRINEKDHYEIKNKNVKDKTKKLKKTCKTCGLEMGFISDFKKHLVCMHCNSVKRLYERKL